MIRLWWREAACVGATVKGWASSGHHLCAGSVGSIASVAKDERSFASVSRWLNLWSNVAFACFSWISVGRAGCSRPSRQTGSEADQADRQAGQILGPPDRGALQARPLSLLRPFPKRWRREDRLRRARGNEAAPLLLGDPPGRVQQLVKSNSSFCSGTKTIGLQLFSHWPVTTEPPSGATAEKCLLSFPLLWNKMISRGSVCFLTPVQQTSIPIYAPFSIKPPVFQVDLKSHEAGLVAVPYPLLPRIFLSRPNADRKSGSAWTRRRQANEITGFRSWSWWLYSKRENNLVSYRWGQFWNQDSGLWPPSKRKV